MMIRILFLWLFFIQASLLRADVEITELDDRIRIEIDGKLFTEWRHKDRLGQNFYPVIGPNGETVTRHYPMKEGVPHEAQDHPHHRSLRFAHADVNGLNFWSFWHYPPGKGRQLTKAEIKLEKIERISSGKTGEFIVWNRWLNDDTLVLRERLHVRITPLEKRQVLMDYDVKLVAGDEPVTFGDSKDGGMYVRVAGTMKVKAHRAEGGREYKGTILNSRGDRNAEAWGKRAEWIDYFGPDASGEIVGIAMFDHPDNLRFPTHWHAREYGLLAANRFGADHFNPKFKAPPGVACRPYGNDCPACNSRGGDYTIAAGKNLTLRHRFYFHHGDSKDAEVAKHYKDYSMAAAVPGKQAGGVKPITLAKKGVTRYTIVQSDSATEPEKFAVEELAMFLKRVTGAEFSVAKENTVFEKDTKRIYVGWTQFAADHGIDTEKLDEEEWVIRTVGEDLLLTGGRPRGTMYAVYEFLEDQIGCHWLDPKTEVVPSKSTVGIDALNIQAKPSFWQRQLHSPTGTADDHWLFLVRNKNFRYDFRGRTADQFFPQGAFSRVASAHTGIHSFSTFVNGEEWFETHPEYFSLVNGKRLPALTGAGPGQLCLTHPDVLRLTVTKLREFIEADRTESAAAGVPPPKSYWITQNDIYHGHCECASCQAIVKREGGESGPLVAFLNAVGAEIEKDYPEVLVGTLAYNLTSTAPKHLRPRDNVLIGWCDVYSKVDGIRPLSHPLNARNFEEITGWGKITPRLAIGDDYWTALGYYKYFPTPYAMIDCVAKDLKLFADQGAESYFAETPDYMDAAQQFIPLKFWLGYQLLVDPDQPSEPLIKIFMDGYFGEASDAMRKYLLYLRKRIDADAQFQMLRDEPHKLAYLDLEFFETSQALFDEAEASVGPAGLEAKHVAVERFTLDGALLYLWPWLERRLPIGKTLPFDRDALIQRYERGWKSLVASRYSRVYTHDRNSLNEDGKMLERMLGLFRDAQLPEKFRNLPPHDVADFNWLTFSQIRPRQKFIPDLEAAGGMTATFTERSCIQRAEKGGNVSEVGGAEQHRKPLVFGVGIGKRLDDKQTITLLPGDIPQDGKYHLYPIGSIRVQEGTTIWALEGARLGVNVDRILVDEASNPKANEWEAWISLKLQGPAYVKGSQRPNGVWMDRVILVR